ncbi:PolyA RNA polymerase protein 1 [Hondaea fermentalgiana]|uniref:PolyA RNA polymerase protein 1 n=1 Tax=Hondaea fermentalgiana TaxID=2315210 RepID=A0A2R5GN68_9STRA|nr:PolyA RNA polymerase protein 1 [Hondaea fermentalgiana]|eukprot:GBG32330.1 PolyA RNA polymerase protein 1 [Hondaea fermentalgiana]
MDPETFAVVVQRPIEDGVEALRLGRLVDSQEWLGDDLVRSKLCALLRIYNQDLEELDLTSNMISDAGADALAQTLTAPTAITHLSLAFNLIRDPGVISIARMLSVNTCLRVISLEDNRIGTQGATALAVALERNSTLQELVLSANCIDDAGLEALAPGIARNRTLRHLDLSVNRIADKGVAALAAALASNRTLVSLELQCNRVGTPGATALAQVLAQNPALATLNIEANAICDPGAKALADALVLNTNLAHLNVRWNHLTHAHDDLILSVARETATPKRTRGADGLSELEEEKSDDSDAESLPDRATMKQPVFQKTLDYEEFEPEAATSDIGSRIRGVLSGRKRKSTVGVDVDLTSPKNQTTDASAPASSDKPDGSFLSVAKFDLKAVEPEKKQNDHAQDGARSGSASEQIKKRRLGPAWTAVQLSPNDPDARRGWRPGPPLLQLHNEILQFVKLIGATKPENTARANDLESIRALTNELFPKSTVEVFGSYANDLCIPNSDVDMVLFGAPASAIFTLSRELSKRDMVEKIETISSARVPIIKMHLKGSPFEIDICFDKESGISTGQMVRKLVQEMPALRPLVLTIKYFLAQRDINETYRGGIGSHLCLCMIVSMLQQFRRRMLLSKDQQNDRVEDLEDLGALLLEFLDLYGRRFNYGKVAISLRHGGSYKTKASMAARQPRPGILSLENPEDPSQDLGSSSYNMYKVRKAFAHAHRMLTKKLSDFADGRTDTVLDGIIIPTNQLADRLSRLV